MKIGLKILEDIGNLIAQDELKQAIEKLRLLLKGSPMATEIIVQSARYNDVMKQIRLGTISSEDSNLTKNKIRFALIQMVEMIEEEASKNEVFKEELKKIDKGLKNNLNQIRFTGNNNINIQGADNSTISINTSSKNNQ